MVKVKGPVIINERGKGYISSLKFCKIESLPPPRNKIQCSFPLHITTFSFALPALVVISGFGLFYESDYGKVLIFCCGLR